MSTTPKPGLQGQRGTRTAFRADDQMFETTDYSFDQISQRLRESAYLTKGIWITLRDERIDRERSFYFEGGLQSFVRHLNRSKETLHQRPIYVGLSNTLIALISLIAPILGGVIAQYLGYEPLFVVALVMTFAALFVTLRYMKTSEEPAAVVVEE